VPGDECIASRQSAASRPRAAVDSRYWVYRRPPVGDPYFQDVVDTTSQVIDAAGVIVVVAGLAIATGTFLLAQRHRSSQTTAYRGYRQQVGKAILLGLEFLVAADIIRTIAVDPTFAGVGVLAVVVAVRTFLSFALEVELEGRWPWQSHSSASR
jgi:uncharacterized membrane protein